MEKIYTDLLTIKDFCTLASISRTNAYKLMNAGELGYVHIGKCRRIPRADYETWKNNLPSYSTQFNSSHKGATK